MNTFQKLEKILQQKEQQLSKLIELVEQEQKLIDQLELGNNIPVILTRKQTAELLEYNYIHLGRLDIPFENRRIAYLDLLEWTRKNRPEKVSLLKKNFNDYRKSS